MKKLKRKLNWNDFVYFNIKKVLRINTLLNNLSKINNRQFN